MAWQPEPAGPRNLRELFHWAYQAFQGISAELPVVPFQQSVNTIEQRLEAIEQRLTDLENGP